MKKITKKPKIMFISSYFPPQYGGVENYVLNIAKGLKKKYNLDLFVVSSTLESKKVFVEEYEGIRVYRLPTLFKLSNTPINPMWYFQINKIIKAEKPDIINTHQPVPFMGDLAAISVGSSTPFFLTYHAGTMKKGIFYIDIFLAFYEKFILPISANRASKIISSSKFVARTVLKNYSDKTIVIHPGADISLFKPNRKIRREKNVILFICRYKLMHKLKGLYNVIKAVKTLPHIKIRVVGEENNEIHDPQVEFVGFKRGKDLVLEVQKASLEIIAPLKHTDSYPTVIVEAMACETPVIGSTSGGIPEMIKNGIDGFLVDTNDTKKMAKAISKILTDKKLALRLGKNARKRVLEDSTWESRVKLTYDTFTTVLDKGVNHENK